MGLEMSPGAVVSKLDAMNVSLNQTVDHAQKMIYTITELEDTGDQLAGEAYDGIRNHFADMHIPVVQAIILYAEAMIQENNAYKGYINGYLGGIGYVNEDKLKDDRRALKDQINQAYSMVIATKSGAYFSWIDSMEHALRLVEDKLDLIADFKAAAGGVYRSIDSYQAILRSGIESLHSMVFDGKSISYPVDSIDRGWKREVESRWSQREQRRIETIKEPFVRNMETHFGFDRETSEILYKLYEGMDIRGEENMDQKFFLMIASIIYPYAGDLPRDRVIVPKSLNDLWYVLVGTYKTGDLDAEMAGYGLSVNEIKKLKEEIGNNYTYSPDEDNVQEEENPEDNANREKYKDKADFAHMSIILALYLSTEENIWTKSGDASGVFNGIYDLKANAGYVGDVYGTGGNGPKLTQDDYKADLDAVNLSARIPKGDNLIVTMNEYYSGINNNVINRADEFAVNIGNGNREAGIELLKEQREWHEVYIRNHTIGEAYATIYMPTLVLAMQENEKKVYISEEEWAERRKIVNNFIASIEDSRNKYWEREEVDIDLAERGEKGEENEK